MARDEGTRSGPQQEGSSASRDAYQAGRDLTINYGAVRGVQVGQHNSQFNYFGSASHEKPARAWNVPARNPSFIGREAQLATISRLAADGNGTVQALYGMGGVGKTQLAIEYAHRHANDYDIVWWLDAESPSLLSQQFTDLAVVLGCARPDTAPEGARRALLAKLHDTSRWLLIFDNAEDPGILRLYLPHGPGHVLITTRSNAWTSLAAMVSVDVLSPAESVRLFRTRALDVSESDAARLAEALGDLPLALAQAAAYLSASGLSVPEYLRLLTDRAAEPLARGRVATHPDSLAAVTTLAYDGLRRADAAAAQVAAICSFLAPEPIPLDWLERAASSLPTALGTRLADPLARGRLLAALTRTSLARLSDGGLIMHPLTQTILRTTITADGDAPIHDQAAALVIANQPEGWTLPSQWPAWARLLPHLLALAPEHSDYQNLRQAALDGARYLTASGHPQDARELASRLYDWWGQSLGPDQRQTLDAANTLALALSQLGDSAGARRLDEETLTRHRRLRDDDTPGALTSANNLASYLRALGQYQAARELDQDTLARLRRLLGTDHPDALASANNLANDLRNLGEHRAARELNEDTLTRYWRVLGTDHPDTLASANNLAIDLRNLGEHRAARELDEDTLTRRQRLLGTDHPDTLASANNLANDLRNLGEHRAARELDEDTLTRLRRTLGADHPTTLTSANNLAIDRYALGDYMGARDLFADTLTRRRRLLGTDHPDTLTVANNLAANLLELGDYEAARELWEDTLAGRQRILGAEHPETQLTARNLDRVRQLLGEPE